MHLMLGIDLLLLLRLLSLWLLLRRFLTAWGIRCTSFLSKLLLSFGLQLVVG